MPHRLNTFSSLSQNPGHSLLFSYSYHTYIWKAVHNIHEPECYQLSNWDGIKRRWWCLLGDLWIILTYLKLICVWVLVSRMLYEPHPLPKSNSCEEAVVNGFFASSIIPGLMVQILVQHSKLQKENIGTHALPWWHLPKVFCKICHDNIWLLNYQLWTGVGSKIPHLQSLSHKYVWFTNNKPNRSLASHMPARLKFMVSETLA